MEIIQNMKVKTIPEKKVFITIGWEHSNIPMGEKIATYIFDNESPVKIAKKLRKQFADNAENHGWVKGTRFNPSQLFYAIYDDIDETQPFAFSENTPVRFLW